MKLPATLYELLILYTPPRSVVAYLQDTAQRYGMSEEAADWLDLVVRVRSGEPIPEMDKFDTPAQPELVKGPVKYG